MPIVPAAVRRRSFVHAHGTGSRRRLRQPSMVGIPGTMPSRQVPSVEAIWSPPAAAMVWPT